MAAMSMMTTDSKRFQSKLYSMVASWTDHVLHASSQCLYNVVVKMPSHAVAAACDRALHIAPILHTRCTRPLAKAMSCSLVSATGATCAKRLNARLVEWLITGYSLTPNKTSKSIMNLQCFRMVEPIKGSQLQCFTALQVQKSR